MPFRACCGYTGCHPTWPSSARPCGRLPVSTPRVPAHRVDSAGGYEGFTHQCAGQARLPDSHVLTDGIAYELSQSQARTWVAPAQAGQCNVNLKVRLTHLAPLLGQHAGRADGAVAISLPSL